MKTGFRMLAVTALFVSLFFICGVGDPVGAASDSEKKTHSVVKGDTLWDVAEKYLANPFFWPKVWQFNPQIANPHLIYPGNQVRIPSPEELESSETKEVAKEAPPRAAIIQGPMAYVGGHLVERALFEASGFILPYGEEAGIGAIVSTWEEKTLLVERDLVHVNLGARDGVQSGDLFQIIHVDDEHVMHPVTRIKLGKKASIQGVLKITNVEEKLSSAIIIKVYNYAVVGDKLRPYQPKPLIGLDDLTQEDKSINGVIIKSTLGKSNLAVRDTVYIDVGSNNAVTPGDRFIIYRGGLPFQVSKKDMHKSGIENFPPDIMGELIVLKTMEETSTAVVVEELYEITKGDRIKYSPRSLPPIKKYDFN
jgi:hypothetical protein